MKKVFTTLALIQPSRLRNFTSMNANLSSLAETIDASSSSRFPVTEAIRQKLTAAFEPTHLEVINESHMHNVPKNSETHFKVVVVSSRFDQVKTPLQRHRLVNGTLAAELEGPVHALSIIAKSPSQWEKNKSVPTSPNCKGGDGSLPAKKGFA